jgi:hypothetical protein
VAAAVAKVRVDTAAGVDDTTSMRLALVVLVISSPAFADTLATTVTRLPLEPSVVIVPKAAGKTPLERYRAHGGPMAANTPLVALVRLEQANSPDVITIDARRDGTTIAIAIDNRRYDGTLHANVVTMPLVEIELGALKPGTYTMAVEERVAHFTKIDEPRKATTPVPRLSEKLTITIQ